MKTTRKSGKATVTIQHKKGSPIFMVTVKTPDGRYDMRLEDDDDFLTRGDARAYNIVASDALDEAIAIDAAARMRGDAEIDINKYAVIKSDAEGWWWVIEAPKKRTR